MFRPAICTALLLSAAIIHLIAAENGPYFVKAPSNIARIEKRSKNNNNDDNFEKFFLKASKSVPRIGRRGSPADFIDPIQQEKDIKYPIWSNLADILEYNPEIFSNPQLLGQLEDYAMMSDDPNQWDKIRYKRDNAENSRDPHKEIPEYRLQQK